MSIIILRRNYLADAVNNKSGYHGTFVRCEISQTWQLASFDIWCALAAWHTGRRILNTTIGVHTGTTRTTLQCNRTKANPTKINTEKQQKRKKSVSDNVLFFVAHLLLQTICACVWSQERFRIELMLTTLQIQQQFRIVQFMQWWRRWCNLCCST